jgi:hypothetical protein
MQISAQVKGFFKKSGLSETVFSDVHFLGNFPTNFPAC